MAKVRKLTSGLFYCISSSLSLILLILLIIFSAIFKNAYYILSYTLYGSFSLLLYIFATLYYWLNINQRKLQIFRKFVNIFSFLLISSNYITIAFSLLYGPWRWALFGISCGFSVLGILLVSIWTNIPKKLLSILYLSLQVLIPIFINPMLIYLSEYHHLYLLIPLCTEIILYNIAGFKFLIKYSETNSEFDIISNILILLGNMCHYIFLFWILFI